jgi:hypothetical protein
MQANDLSPWVAAFTPHGSQRSVDVHSPRVRQAARHARRNQAYDVAHNKQIPTIQIGNRYVVPKALGDAWG